MHITLLLITGEERERFIIPRGNTCTVYIIERDAGREKINTTSTEGVESYITTRITTREIHPSISFRCEFKESERVKRLCLSLYI